MTTMTELSFKILSAAQHLPAAALGERPPDETLDDEHLEHQVLHVLQTSTFIRWSSILELITLLPLSVEPRARTSAG